MMKKKEEIEERVREAKRWKVGDKQRQDNSEEGGRR